MRGSQRGGIRLGAARPRMTLRGRMTLASLLLPGLVGGYMIWPGPPTSPQVATSATSVPAPSYFIPAAVAAAPPPADEREPAESAAPDAPKESIVVSSPVEAPPEVATVQPPAAIQERAAVPPADWLAPPVTREELAALEIRGGRYVRSASRANGRSRAEVEYTLDPKLTDAVWRVLQRGRVQLGHALVMDAQTGALHAYASTDPERFPAQGVYPAASLVKVVTAAATLERAPGVARETCRYSGSPYKLYRRHLRAPATGREASLRRALATSNNQCFARWAVDRVGADGMLAAFDRFGLLRVPAHGHGSGQAQVPQDDALALGRLGSGLAGLQITPLHAVQLAGVLAHGRRVEPHWIASKGIGSAGRPAALGERVLSEALAGQLREMLVDTTRRGTARRAFRTRNGRPLLQGVAVAGKTGSLNGQDPDGRYEWFIGVAPAENPRIAVATVAVQGDLYWMSASQMAAEIFKAALCPRGVCRVAALDRLDPPPVRTAAR